MAGGTGPGTGDAPTARRYSTSGASDPALSFTERPAARRSARNASPAASSSAEASRPLASSHRLTWPSRRTWITTTLGA